MCPSLPLRSYLNAANGIFIGYDTLSDHLVRGCILYRNQQDGIRALRGSSEPQRLVLERNYEFENRGLPPDMTALHAAERQSNVSDFDRRLTRIECGAEQGDQDALIAKADILLTLKDFAGAAGVLLPLAEAGHAHAQCQVCHTESTVALTFA